MTLQKSELPLSHTEYMKFLSFLLFNFFEIVIKGYLQDACTQRLYCLRISGGCLSFAMFVCTYMVISRRFSLGHVADVVQIAQKMVQHFVSPGLIKK